MWVTFHLFCFAVFQKNLKKLEVLYVVTSLLVPAVIAAVPLITNSYGHSPDGAVCYMYAENEAAFIERFALWDGPASIAYAFDSVVGHGIHADQTDPKSVLQIKLRTNIRR